MNKRRSLGSVSAPLAAALAAVAVTALAGVGCKGKKVGGGPTAPAAQDAGAVVVASDAGAPGGDPNGDGPDEATLRAGKRTGLGGPDQKPEVATEELIEAMVAGTVPWTRWIDPVQGVVALKVPADADDEVVVRRCGAELTAALDALTAAMKTAAASSLGYALDCDNVGLFTVDPSGASPAATCSLESPAGGTIIVDLVFVPDAARGLRLVGISTLPSDGDATTGLETFEAEMARTDARCP